MANHINVAHHLWSKILGSKINTIAISNLIYKTIRDGEWRYQANGSIRIILKVGQEFVVVTGKIINSIFNIGDAWVWNGSGNIWG